MAGRQRTTFAKLQRERARQAKQESKRAKRHGIELEVPTSVYGRPEEFTLDPYTLGLVQREPEVGDTPADAPAGDTTNAATDAATPASESLVDDAPPAAAEG